MDKDTIQYIEGKHESFKDMFSILKFIHNLQDNDIKIINSDAEELNKERLEKVLDRAQEFMP